MLCIVKMGCDREYTAVHEKNLLCIFWNLYSRKFILLAYACP